MPHMDGGDRMSKSELILASGRTIHLNSLHQWAVYSGLLEGLPTREMNAGMIERACGEARTRNGHEPFLIEPVQTPIEEEGGYPFGEPAALPAIGCVADFVAFGGDYYTSLTVIWFQDDYAFPISLEAERALVALDWEKLAKEQEL